MQTAWLALFGVQMLVGMTWMVTGSLSCAYRHATHGLGVSQEHPRQSILRREILIKRQNQKHPCYVILPSCILMTGGARQQPAIYN